jgi:hypothetical protein
MNKENKEPNESISEENRKSAELFRGIRQPKINLADRLVCEGLFFANHSTNPSQIISHICSAAMNFKTIFPETKNIDFNKLEQIYRINQAFIGAATTKIDKYQTMKSLAYGFDCTEEFYKENIEPWARNVSTSYFSQFIRIHRDLAFRIYHSPSIRIRLSNPDVKKCERTLRILSVKEAKENLEETLESIIKDYPICPGCYLEILTIKDLYYEEITVVNPYPKWSWFFEKINYLTESGFGKLRAAFEGYAVPICKNASGIMSQKVDRTTYNEVVRLYLENQRREGIRDENTFY